MKDETFPIEINHNPVVEVIKEIDDIKDKPNEKKIISIIENEKILNEITEEEKEKTLNSIILLTQIINITEATNDTEEKIHKINNDVITKISTLLDYDKIKEVINSSEMLISGPLSIYYSLLNEKYITEQSLLAIEKVTSCLMKDSPDLIEELLNYAEEIETIRKDAKEDFINIITSTVGKLSKIAGDYLQEAKKESFNEAKFETDPKYKINNSIIINDISVKIKETIENHAMMSMIISPNQKIINKNFNVTSKDKDSAFTQYQCGMNYKEIINEMKLKNEKLKICLPSSILSKFENIKNIGMIEYEKYPLLNPNLTKDISSNFISLKFFEENYQEMNISNLEEPIRLIIKKPYNSFNECIFYDESTKKVNSSDCTSKDLGDYVVCSCTHLTDFSLSKYNPVSIFKDVINLFSQIRIINSFEPFKYLNKDNAFVLYVFCGLFGVYFILLGVMIYLDNSGKSDFFVMVVDKDEKCCSKDENNN